MTSIYTWLAGKAWWLVVFAALCMVILGQRAQVSNAKAATARLQTAIAQGKADSSAKLAAVTASVLAQQKTIDSLHAQQEQKDAENVLAVAGLQSDLAVALATRGSRLFKPAAVAGRGSSGGSAQGGDAAHASAGAENPAQGAGVLRDDAKQLLAQLMSDADQINLAYISCRNDAQVIRGRAGADYSLPTGGKLGQ